MVTVLGPPLTAIDAGDAVEVADVASAAERDPIEGWWASTSTGAGDVVPDGAVDVIWTPGRTPFIAGPDREPRPSGLAAGRRVVGVRLRPGVAAAVLGDRVDRATGLTVPLDQVWTSADVDRLAHELGDADGDAGRAGALADAVTRCLPVGWRPDAAVVHAIERIRTVGGTDGSFRAAAADTDGIGDRQFRRRFSAAMGYGPAFYARIVRLDRFVDLVDRHANRTLAELAAHAGFTDQSHLARDVRQLLGTTPAQLRSAT